MNQRTKWSIFQSFLSLLEDRLVYTSFPKLKPSQGHEKIDDLNMIPQIHPNPIIFIDPDAGFHPWGIPNNWMVQEHHLLGWMI